MPVDTSIDVNLAEEDLQLRHMIAGKRLLCEVLFDRHLIESLRDALFTDPGGAWNYPSVAAVVTVGIGTYWYESGDLWNSFPVLTSPNHRARWGQAFEEFLEGHESLETFSFLRDQGAHRYVAPILAHGGIPDSCFENFFSLMCRHCTHDQTGEEALEYFENAPRALSGAHKPVKRFISFGGESAEDLVERLLVLWRSLESGYELTSFGLPKRIRDAFADWYERERPDLRAGHRSRFPSPIIQLDPRVMTIGLHLPACAAHPDAEDEWVVCGDRVPSDIPVTIPIGQRPEWEVKCGRRAFNFKGFGDGANAMFFDPASGKLIRDPQRRRLPVQVWALIQDGTEADPAPTHCEPFLPWAGSSICAFNLDGVKRLRIGDTQFEVRRPFFEVGQQPAVSNAFSSETGAPVFYAPPDVSWQGEADLAVTKEGHDEGSIPVESQQFGQLLDEPGEYRIDVRGPLGQNLTCQFLLVPGLSVQSEPGLRLPGSPTVTWTVSAPNATIRRDDEECARFTSAVGSSEMEVVFGDQIFRLRLTVPQLEWCVTRDPKTGSSEWSTAPLVLEAESLISDITLPVFVCRFPGKEANNRVYLKAERGDAVLVPRCLSVDGEVFWHFRLDEVRDDLLATGKSERFDLAITADQGRPPVYRGQVLDIRPQWDITDLSAEWKLDESGYTIDVLWEERDHSVEGRWLVMQPIWRPWESANIVQEIAPGERTRIRWTGPDGRIRPGRYLIRAIHSPWGPPDPENSCDLKTFFIDIHPEIWGEFFDCGQDEFSLGFFLETLLAHAYRPERVKAPTDVPTGLDSGGIRHFLRHVEAAQELGALIPHSLGDVAIKFCCVNAEALSEALMNSESLPDVSARLLPPLPLLQLAPNAADKEFLFDLVLNYEGLRSRDLAIKVANGHRPRQLSEPLREWRNELRGARNRAHKVPQLEHLVFLCERFDLLNGRSQQARNDYLRLRKGIPGWESS